MSTATAPHAGQIAVLRSRESATASMVRQIDAKIARLGSARSARAQALNTIRHELVVALSGAPAAPDHHANR